MFATDPSKIARSYASVSGSVDAMLPSKETEQAVDSDSVPVLNVGEDIDDNASGAMAAMKPTLPSD